jgi:peptidoglycan/xylan/chitin deacetylase (PgdA/CDA1 family)
MTGERPQPSLLDALRFAPGPRRAVLATLSLFRRIAAAPPGVYTLCYHHFASRHRRGFARQIDYLARFGKFIGADRAVDLLSAGKPLTKRYFVVSADDGYADLVEVALPVLAERGVPAIAFLVGAWLDEPPHADGSTDGYMSRADLETWCRAGMEVGSHGHSHRHVINLSESEILDELHQSAAAIAHATGKVPRHFACPWGVPGRDFEPEVTARLAESAGYVSLFTTKRGIATGPSDLWQMPRHSVEPEWRLRDLDVLMGAFSFARRQIGDRQSWNREQWRSSS